MRKVAQKFRQVTAILLTVGMIVTSLPDNGNIVYAAEATESVEVGDTEENLPVETESEPAETEVPVEEATESVATEGQESTEQASDTEPVETESSVEQPAESGTEETEAYAVESSEKETATTEESTIEETMTEETTTESVEKDAEAIPTYDFVQSGDCWQLDTEEYTLTLKFREGHHAVGSSSGNVRVDWSIEAKEGHTLKECYYIKCKRNKGYTDILQLYTKFGFSTTTGVENLIIDGEQTVSFSLESQYNTSAEDEYTLAYLTWGGNESLSFTTAESSDPVVIYSEDTTQDSIAMDIERVGWKAESIYYAPVGKEDQEKKTGFSYTWNKFEFKGLEAETEYYFDFANSSGNTIFRHLATTKAAEEKEEISVTYNALQSGANIVFEANIEGYEGVVDSFQFDCEFTDALGRKLNKLEPAASRIEEQDGKQVIKATAFDYDVAIVAGESYSIKMCAILNNKRLEEQVVTLTPTAEYDEDDITFSVVQNTDKQTSVDFAVTINNATDKEGFYKIFSVDENQGYSLWFSGLTNISGKLSGTITGLTADNASYNFILFIGGVKKEASLTLTGESDVKLKLVGDGTNETNPFDIVRTFAVESSDELTDSYRLELSEWDGSNYNKKWCGYTSLLNSDNNYQTTIYTAKDKVYFQPGTLHKFRWDLCEVDASGNSTVVYTLYEQVTTPEADIKVEETVHQYDTQSYQLILGENVFKNYDSFYICPYIREKDQNKSYRSLSTIYCNEAGEGTLSLTGLKPETAYEVSLRSPDVDVEWYSLSFTTPKETRKIQIALPTDYSSYGVSESCVSELWYASGADNDLEQLDLAQNSTTATLTAFKGEPLRFKVVLKDKYRLDTVSARKESDSEYTNLAATEDIYTIANVTENMYIRMNTSRVYPVTFVSDHAKVLQIVGYDENGQEITEEIKDIVKLSASDNFAFKIVPNEGYTFKSVKSNNAGILARREKGSQNYTLWIRNERYIGEKTEITVTADPTQSYQLSFSYLDDKVTVSAKADTQVLELSENAVTVEDDQKISFSVKLNDISTGVFVRYKDSSDIWQTLSYGSSELTDENENGVYEATIYDFYLGYLRNGDVAVEITVVDLHKITFEASRIESIHLISPAEQDISFNYYDENDNYVQNAKGSVSVPDGYELKFGINGITCEMGKVFVSTDGAESGKITPTWDADMEQSWYTIVPEKDMTITLDVKPFEYKINYLEDEAEVLVFDADNGNPIELSKDHTIGLYSEKNLLIKIKPTEGRRVSVTCSSSDESWWLESEFIDGYYCYSVYAGYDYSNLQISCPEVCKLTFVKQGQGVTIHKMYKEYWDENEWDWSSDEEIIDVITVDKEKPFYFDVEYDGSDNNLDYVSTTGDADGGLKVYSYYDEYRNIYRLLPTEDMTITVKTTQRQNCLVDVSVGNNIESWQVNFNLGESMSGTKTSTTTKENDGAMIYATAKEGYRPKVTYTVGGEKKEAAHRYSEGSYYWIKITGNTKISIEAVPISQNTVTFAGGEQLDQIVVWETGHYGEREQYKVTDQKISLDDDKYYYFDLISKDGTVLSSVTKTNSSDSTGTQLKKGTDYESGVRGYVLGYLEEDVIITSELEKGYTICFNTEQASGVSVYSRTEYDSYNEEYLNITDKRCHVTKTESYSFFLNNGYCDVSVDGRYATLTRAYDYNQSETIYTITPKSGVELPDLIQVVVVKQSMEKHNITFEYPQNLSVSLFGNKSFYDKIQQITDPTVEVSGPQLTLLVTSIGGYTNLVTMQGASDKEPIVLPKMKSTSPTDYFFIGTLTEDKTIKITTEKSETNKYYYYGFAGSNAYIMETAHSTQYGMYETWDEYSNDYRIAQGESVSFYVEPHYGYTLKSVSANGKELTPVWNDEQQRYIYIVTLTEDTKFTISSVRNIRKYPLTFVYPKSVKSVAVKGYTLENNQINVAKDEKIYFTVELADQYHEIVSVKANGQHVSYNKQGNYYVMLMDATATEVQITTTSQDKMVSITSPLEHMSYSVETNALVRPDGDKYIVAQTADAVELTVVSTRAKHIPEVTYKNIKGEMVLLETAKSESTEKGIAYTYRIPVAEMGYDSAIVIGETIEKQRIAVNYTASEVRIASARIGAQELVLPAGIDAGNGTTTIVLDIPYEETVTIAVEALENCEITGAITRQNETEIAQKTNKDKCEFSVTALADAETVIRSKGLYHADVITEVSSGQSIADQDDIYWVDADQQYTVGALYGVATKATLSQVTLRSGISAIKSTVEIAPEDTTRAIIHIDRSDAGKTLKLKVYVNDNGEEVVVASYMLRVRPELKNLLVDGVTGGKLEQTIDMVKEYSIKLNPETADNSVLAMEITPSQGQQETSITASVSKGILTIDTTKSKENDSATIKLYNSRTSTEAVRDYVEGGTFDIVAVSPKALVNGTPQLKLKGVDDISLALLVTAPDRVEKPVAGRQYYKLVVTPKQKDGQALPETIAAAVKNPYFVEKTEEASQAIELTVNTAAYGKGQEWSFDVTVLLVQTKDGEALTLENEKEKTAFVSKEGTITNISTKNPSYETKLTLKKGTTTVYTTQQEAVAATVVYSKETSFARIDAVRDITELKNEGLALNVWEEDGKIFVTAPAGTQLGKHTLEVVAYGSDTMYRTRENLTVNVVKGIETLSVKIPKTQLYKVNKKAVTLKATPIYNESGTAPKNKKVTWDIVDVNGKPFELWDVLNGKVTVKNGTVTVDKNLVLSPDAEDNQFRVRATAADYDGNIVYGFSDVIQLSASPLEIGAVYIMKQNTAGLYEVVVKDGSSAVTTDILSGAEVIALRSDAPKTDTYTQKEIDRYRIAVTNLTYKVSTKAVSIAADGENAWIKVTKPANNIKLTLTTADGGKKNAAIKFSIAYMKPAELGLAVSDEFGGALAEKDAKEISFAGTTNRVLRLIIQQKAEKDSAWDALFASTNYTLSVKGGTIIASDAENGVFDLVITTKQATVTLSDKENNVKKSYGITNTAYSNAKAPKVTMTKEVKAGAVIGREVLFKASGNYDYKGKSVILETDRIDQAGKNNANCQYSLLEAACDLLNTRLTIQDDGTFKISFKDTYIPAGSYKLKLTFGQTDASGVFVANAKPVSLTLKVVTPKHVRGSFKPVTTYKMQATAGVGVTLSGKGKLIKSYQFEQLLNANVKGQENAFMTYFELKNNVLSLRSDLTSEQISYLKSKEGQKDLTGYVTYTVLCGDNGYGIPDTLTKTTKITIKLK